MSTDLVKKMVNLLIDSLDDNVDEEALDAQIADFRRLNMFKDQTDEFFNRVKAEFSSRIAISLDIGTVLKDKRHKKWFKSRKVGLDMKYWSRYERYLLSDKSFSPNVVNSMDDILDELTDLLGDPESENGFSRKGLVIGDVQSGKTANYTGLICKAADSGYKVIVLLTGTIEKLRRQTQIRLDEGFVGFDSHAMQFGDKDVRVGVSRHDDSINAITLTSTTDDFKTKTANNMIFDLQSVNAPVIFVIKKNVTTMKRLYKWLSTFNRKGDGKIKQPLLMVDDESDNASVNTSGDDSDPTKTNDHIRKLLGLFEKSSYIGYTATPFANIFIDPLTNESMLSEDLFPKDYIYSLDAPSNYIGARNVFGEVADKDFIVRELTLDEEVELSEIIPLSHKKDHLVDFLPQSMIEAIRVFLISNVIRDLRGDTRAHRSMLINVSRFTDVQARLGSLVNRKIKEIQSSARLFSNIPPEQASENHEISMLEKMFIEKFKSCDFIWEDILEGLFRGIGNVEVIVINQKSGDDLNYEDYPDGRRVIAVGGLSLSRGLTLEGLMTSYIYRNTRMYDTLLQMGRWFGYRNNYDDLCRIFLTGESKEWYGQISEASDELRDDIKRKQNSGLTPLDFGIRVRSDKNALLVTARNKMRTSEERTLTISLSETTIETTDIFSLEDKNAVNRDNIDAMVRKLNSISTRLERYGNSFAYKDVPKSFVLDFLDEYHLPSSNEYFDIEVLSRFISNYQGHELESWDIGFASGSDQGDSYFIRHGSPIKNSVRGFSAHGNHFEMVRMSGSKRRLGNISDGNIGLGMKATDILHWKSIAKRKFGYDLNKRKSLSQKDYFKAEYINKERNPLLMIYFVKLRFNEGTAMIKKYNPADIETLKSFGGRMVYGLGMGIPKLFDTRTEYATYRVNKIFLELDDEYDLGDEE